MCLRYTDAGLRRKYGWDGRTANVTHHTIRPETVVTSNLRLHPQEGLLDLLLVTTQLWSICPLHHTTRIPPSVLSPSSSSQHMRKSCSLLVVYSKIK
ncbi:hypothetical protein Pcinc_028781 [Petrolisthes cinctipes]|uniref:Uncharacterized protein n=1 Tax=Petrolisthes cinctipes TaxID=88211 RepID=A0AAE1F264_PETCI|nr:hypothetical protein Pcinc_028781 [Petrolisthes cinctipes]